jgi:metal-sulfur cluster biosynthetic enzyme
MTNGTEADEAQRWFERQNQASVEDQVREALKGVVDPEMGINIVDLGLVYETRVSPEGEAEVVMTLTSPGCPLGPVIEDEVRRALGAVYGVGDVRVTIVWNPPWRPEMMSEDAKLELGYW